jgi:hypothetical protein
MSSDIGTVTGIQSSSQFANVKASGARVSVPPRLSPVVQMWAAKRRAIANGTPLRIDVEEISDHGDSESSASSSDQDSADGAFTPTADAPRLGAQAFQSGDDEGGAGEMDTGDESTASNDSKSAFVHERHLFAVASADVATRTAFAEDELVRTQTVPQMLIAKSSKPMVAIVVALPVLFVLSWLFLFLTFAETISTHGFSLGVVAFLYRSLLDAGIGLAALKHFGSPYLLLHAAEELNTVMDAAVASLPARDTFSLYTEAHKHTVQAIFGLTADPAAVYDRPTQAELIASSQINWADLSSFWDNVITATSLVFTQNDIHSHLVAMTVDFVSMSPGIDAAKVTETDVPIQTAFNAIYDSSVFLAGCAAAVVEFIPSELAMPIDILRSVSLDPASAAYAAAYDVSPRCVIPREIASALLIVETNLSPLAAGFAFAELLTESQDILASQYQVLLLQSLAFYAACAIVTAVAAFVVHRLCTPFAMQSRLLAVKGIQSVVDANLAALNFLAGKPAGATAALCRPTTPAGDLIDDDDSDALSQALADSPPDTQVSLKAARPSASPFWEAYIATAVQSSSNATSLFAIAVAAFCLAVPIIAGQFTFSGAHGPSMYAEALSQSIFISSQLSKAVANLFLAISSATDSLDLPLATIDAWDYAFNYAYSVATSDEILAATDFTALSSEFLSTLYGLEDFINNDLRVYDPIPANNLLAVSCSLDSYDAGASCAASGFKFQEDRPFLVALEFVANGLELAANHLGHCHVAGAFTTPLCQAMLSLDLADYCDLATEIIVPADEILATSTLAPVPPPYVPACRAFDGLFIVSQAFVNRSYWAMLAKIDRVLHYFPAPISDFADQSYADALISAAAVGAAICMAVRLLRVPLGHTRKDFTACLMLPSHVKAFALLSNQKAFASNQ